MALLQPYLLFDKGVLRVTYCGELSPGQRSEVDIPLENDAALFDLDSDRAPSKVCGENIHAQAYISEEINSFFSEALCVPCVLARFPAGGRGSSCRLSKARLSKHQKAKKSGPLIPGSFPDVPSPPDSDSEPQNDQQQPQLPSNILLSNESPILMIHTASVDQVNRDIIARGGAEVSEYAFRANIIVENDSGHEAQPAYSEDFWSSVRIGGEKFITLGACQRCQMVCVDQDTGEKKQEPLSTLAKTRRLNSKIYFGVHMRHDHGREGLARPTIQVGDVVSVERTSN
ncbi:Molybdenum cofactor sulfurase [Escovopsis weberi]|uniref:Molybdenum cofactor sulfurase n=1 Tax=Escovopsis weberi TaxID=150374 RepID=A0A0M8N6A8_ESCWE|nr:Molybdenum cofactor sulfurase [Escovopsis weberi]